MPPQYLGEFTPVLAITMNLESQWALLLTRPPTRAVADVVMMDCPISWKESGEDVASETEKLHIPRKNI